MIMTNNYLPDIYGWPGRDLLTYLLRSSPFPLVANAHTYALPGGPTSFLFMQIEDHIGSLLTSSLFGSPLCIN